MRKQLVGYFTPLLLLNATLYKICSRPGVFLIWLLLTTIPGQAEEVFFEPTVITENTEQLNLNEVAEYLVDVQGTLTVEDLQRANFDQRFQKVDEEVVNAGVTRSRLLDTF